VTEFVLLVTIRSVANGLPSYQYYTDAYYDDTATAARSDGDLSVYIQQLSYVSRCHNGATENAGVENAIRAKMQGWKMQE